MKYSGDTINKKMNKYTLTQIRAEVLKKGFTFFEDKENKGYDVNIVGIRSLTRSNSLTNEFDDLITVSFKDENDEWQYYEWKATTDPSKELTKLVPGQYISTWSIDLHQGKYEALCQLHGKVRVCTDLTYDENKVAKGMFGVNIRFAGEDSMFEGKHLAGCQAFKRKTDFNKFMGILKKAAEIHGNKFSYTLLEL